jgi:polyhydroxyalkanoate synthase subunit PhaC
MDMAIPAANLPAASADTERKSIEATPVADRPVSVPPWPLEPTDDEAADIHGFPADRLVHAWQAQFTAGLSPAALLGALADWGIHLANAPGKQADLVRKAFRKWVRFAYYASRAPLAPDTPPAIEPLPGDRRFIGADWQTLPYSLMWQGFLFTQQWWHNATTGVRGVDPRAAEIVRFTMRQLLDAVSPSNFMMTNPEVLRVTVETGGQNLVQGWQNFLEDAERTILGRPPVGAEKYRIGRDVAATPGKVVYRNRLIELIQYSPATESVYAEPILIVPAWIMKYYVLDLSPANSLVRYLVSRGHTVFMISWKNPTEADRELGMDDYLELGPVAALAAVRAIVPDAKVHAVGYCLGGTLLSIAAARLSARGEPPLKTMTLLAAQTDFTEAGELMLFINNSQVTWLEDMMWDQGYLDTKQMAGAFQLLRSNDLVWSRLVRQYLMGQRPDMNDFAAWNADATRMPYRMHSEYLRHLFLDNDLAEGRYRAGGEPVSLADIKLPIFAVGTTRDHIAPWRSVYKITWQTDADVTFVLATGGHNVGIVSEPGADGPDRPRRGYRIHTLARGDRHVDPETWFSHATAHDGSWWPTWAKWLEAWSGEMVAPPPLGAPERGYPAMADEPGTYVLAR